MLYLIDRSDLIPTICFEVSQNDSQPERSLIAFAMPMTEESLVGYVALTGEILNLPDAHQIPAQAPYRHHKTFDDDIGYYTRSVLVLPMQNPEKQIIGVMQLINRKTAPDLTVTPENVDVVTQAYSDWEKKVLRSLASLGAIAIERNQLLSQSC